MKVDGILPFARNLIQKAASEGDTVIDATVGNGHDTLFLARLVGKEGHVYGFDIQKQALEAARRKLSENGLLEAVTLFETGHENISDWVPADKKIAAAIFNTGYLPGSDKSVFTKPHTTIRANEKIFDVMKIGGIIVLVVYHGHEQGAIEKAGLLQYASELDQEKAFVLQYSFLNKKNNPPFVLAIEKRADRN